MLLNLFSRHAIQACIQLYLTSLTSVTYSSEKNKRFLLRRTEREIVNVEDLYESLPSFREKSERRYG